MKMVCWSYLRLPSVLSLSVILLALAGNSGIKAQNSQGTILGRVTDQSGSVVAGASLKLTNRDTGVFHETKTNSVGDYVFFVNIIPGNLRRKGGSVRVQEERSVFASHRRGNHTSAGFPTDGRRGD